MAGGLQHSRGYRHPRTGLAADAWDTALRQLVAPAAAAPGAPALQLVRARRACSPLSLTQWAGRAAPHLRPVLPMVTVALCPSTRMSTMTPAAAGSSWSRWHLTLPGGQLAPPRVGMPSDPRLLRRAGGCAGSSHLHGGLAVDAAAGARAARWQPQRGTDAQAQATAPTQAYGVRSLCGHAAALPGSVGADGAGGGRHHAGRDRRAAKEWHLRVRPFVGRHGAALGLSVSHSACLLPVGGG